MPRHVNTSLKAADRITGLRPKVEKPRGAPPPWADWIHKFGPLMTAVVTAIIFIVTLKYTVEPVYRRALLEEANARLESDRVKLVNENVRIQSAISSTTSSLALREKEIQAARLRLNQLESLRLLATTASIASKREAMALAIELRESKASLATTASELIAKRVALWKTESDLAARSSDVEKALAQTIRNLMAANALPYTVGAVYVMFREIRANYYFQKPCVATTLEDRNVPFRLLPDERRAQLVAIANSIDNVHASERLALLNEGNNVAKRASELQSNDRELRSILNEGNSTATASSKGTVEMDYQTRDLAIRTRQEERLKHIEIVGEFLEKSNAFVKRLHDEFLLRMGS